MTRDDQPFLKRLEHSTADLERAIWRLQDELDRLTDDERASLRRSKKGQILSAVLLPQLHADLDKIVSQLPPVEP